MKTREWIFTIAIVILIQFIVQVGALIFSNDNNVLNYISFAGTIVSIILAAIAIVYSFVQTISQQNTSSNISNQVEKLMSIVNEIDTNKKLLGDSLEHLKSVSQKIDLTIEHQSHINSQVEKISKNLNNHNLEKIYDLFNSEISSKSTTNKHHSEENHQKPLTNGYNGTRFASIGLFFGAKNKILIDEVFDKVLLPAIKDLVDISKDTKGEIFLSNQEGTFTGTRQTLESFELLEVNSESGEFKLSKNFETECANFIEYYLKTNPDNEDDEFIKSFIESLNKFNT